MPPFFAQHTRTE